jgi:hypothetical protein
MAQATLARILEDIKTLEIDEIRKVDAALQQQIEMAGYSPAEWRVMQSLVDDGLLKEIKPRRLRRSIDFKPVPIKGKPLSETIVEERR